MVQKHNTLMGYGTDLENLTNKELQLGGMLSDQQKQTAVLGGIGSVASIGSMAINYDMLKTENLFKENQAKQIEIQAQEQANMLRENFNVMLGQEAVQTARRGITQSSGSVRAGKELSAKNVGEDITKMKDTAKAKSGKIRAEASIAKRAGKAQMMSSISSGIGSLNQNYKDYKLASKTGAEYKAKWKSRQPKPRMGLLIK